VTTPRMPGATRALTIVTPPQPVLRLRFRDGILVDQYGFPDWVPYARVLVDLPAPPAGLTVDEVRVLDVLVANEAMSRVGSDPLWGPPAGGTAAVATPAGWCWAHLGPVRRLALVPVELHGAHRHGGGVRVLARKNPARGLRASPPWPPLPAAPGDEVPEEIIDHLEQLLGRPLPGAYRQYLAATNGAAPAHPAVLPGLGLVADQPLFGVARTDQAQDLAYARHWFADRFTPDLLPVGHVQGGVLAVRLAGPDAGSVWWYDDDDPREDERHDAAYVSTRLLYPCGRDFAEFWAALSPPPARLLGTAREQAAAGLVRPVTDEVAGAALPEPARGPAQPAATTRTRSDPVTDMFR